MSVIRELFENKGHYGHSVVPTDISNLFFFISWTKMLDAGKLLQFSLIDPFVAG